MPDILHPVEEIWSFSAEMGIQEAFNFSQLVGVAGKLRSSSCTTARICFSSYTDCMVGGCHCLSNFFGMESYGEKGKKNPFILLLL